jgi:hypothetical protein
MDEGGEPIGAKLGLCLTLERAASRRAKKVCAFVC